MGWPVVARRSSCACRCGARRAAPARAGRPPGWPAVSTSDESAPGPAQCEERQPDDRERPADDEQGLIGRASRGHLAVLRCLQIGWRGRREDVGLIGRGGWSLVVDWLPGGSAAGGRTLGCRRRARGLVPRPVAGLLGGLDP